MKIFLTGGTGFVGSHFLRSPLARLHEIVALRREGSFPCLPIPVEPVWLHRALDAITPNDINGCSVLVHLASPGVSPKKASWDELFYWNVTVALQLIEKAKIAGVQRIIVAGTFAEYGRSADRFDPIPPDAPLEPITGYAASKAAACIALSAYAAEHGIELAYLRIFSAFGEGQCEGNFWPALRKAALLGLDFPMTLGEQVRDYVPIEDVVAMFWRACTSAPLTAGYPLIANIGSGYPVILRVFAEGWWARFNATGRLLVGALPYRQNEVMRFVPIVKPL